MRIIHSYWAYIVLVLLFAVVINSIIGWFSKKEFTKNDKNLALFSLISTHIQLLIGVIAFFTSAYFEVIKTSGMGAVMKSPDIRKAIIEHPTMMILAVISITIGFSKHKKISESTNKFKTISIFYGLALIFTLAMIPWKMWLHF